jgi:osmotically-inducible protein OsmY
LYEISVAVEKGVATLTGRVDSYAERRLAEEVAAGAKGVLGISNKIAVRRALSRSDDEIEEDIEGLLAASAWIDDGLIEVEVDDGNAVLSGSVGSAVEKTRARRKARVVGVKSVDDSDLEVVWWMRDRMRRKSKYATPTDQQIKEAVADALAYDPRVSSFNPRVEVSDGAVTLTGQVDNLRAKRAAERDARNTVGVWRVTNLLRVRTEESSSDEEIRRNVKKALIANVYVDERPITTSVYNGHVYLYGRADSRFQKQQAEEAASGVDDVAAVYNYLTVGYDYEHPVLEDLEIRADIQDQLRWSPFVDSRKVRVTILDGVATLRGTVDNWTAWSAARANALEGGARRVINKLRVKGR